MDGIAPVAAEPKMSSTVVDWPMELTLLLVIVAGEDGCSALQSN